FPPGLFDEMFAAYYQLLTLLAEDEVAWHDAYLPVLPDAYRALYAEVDATEAPLTDDLLHTLFSERAALQPQQQAVVSPQRTLTYEEVARYTAALAPRLRQLGARPNRLVGVVMEKGWEQVVAVLSILQAGAAYLPIDPALPDERLLYLLEHGEVELVLTQSWLDQRFPWPADLRRLCVDTECPPGAYLDTPLPRVEPLQCPSDLAYVIYTSGSTGLPKGVMIDHRGAVNTILDMNQRFQVTSADRVLALSALHFDLSVYDIFGTLAAGGTIVYPTESSERDPRAWLELLIEQRVTIWNSVPALLQMFVEYIEDHKLKLEGACLRLALLSGDWIPLTLPESLWKLLPQVAIMSLGGATEASIWSIMYPITSINPAWKSIPYGKAMKNQRVAVLNERCVARPPWVPGPLYIGGVGVAAGYWRDEEKTSRSFLRHPVTGERLYRTGDLGRYLPDGNIEFLGREDFQVKIRGYRIELGEIEAALLQHEAVQAAVVTTYNETGQASNQRLVGYIVPTQEIIAASNGAISAQSLDAFQEYFAGATIHDASERTQFKLRQPSLRHEEALRYVQLARPRYTDELLKSYMERRSHRQFDATPLSLWQLSDFLSCLYQIEVE
ncbi:MAG TPA: amino acid adenylation domain-containing protein, partial [Ktedonobacteraceae bacterium]|nr:amino acid adenylation domain-containing protein [Ktedonobacteraceae bacterium]